MKSIQGLEFWQILMGVSAVAEETLRFIQPSLKYSEAQEFLENIGHYSIEEIFGCSYEELGVAIALPETKGMREIFNLRADTVVSSAEINWNNAARIVTSLIYFNKHKPTHRLTIQSLLDLYIQACFRATQDEIKDPQLADYLYDTFWRGAKG